MPADLDDLGLLWEMRAAAREARSFVEGVTFDDFLRDSMRRRAVQRVIEIVGEAARGVSTPFRDAHPEIPWRIIIAQRHILAHDYPFVLADRIWRVATDHLEPLIAQLDELLPPTDP